MSKSVLHSRETKYTKESLMWEILGITPTTDEDRIKAAYRTKLVDTNPEENPEGFKELRQAYEEACKWAQKANKKKSPLEQWIYNIEQIYENFYRRIDEDEWEEVFEDEICTDLDTFEEARMELVHFFMSHYFLPQFVWKKAWEVFEFEDDRDILRDKISNDYLTYMQFRAEHEDYFDYQLFEGDFDSDYDDYIRKAQFLKVQLEENKLEAAKSLVTELEQLEIEHPYVKIEIVKYYMKIEDDHWKAIWEELQSELFEDPILDELHAEILFREKKYEEAENVLKEILEEKTDFMAAKRMLVKLYQTTGEYEKGKKVCLDVLDGKIPDEKICMALVEINEKLIEMWKDREDKQIDLGWCYYQNQKFIECLEVLRKLKPEGEIEFDYYNLIARVLLETEDYQEGYEMTKIWISNIEKLKGDEKDYDRKSKRYGYAHFIASMHCLEMGMEEKSDAYFRRSLELDQEQMDLLMYRERRMDSFLKRKEYEKCVREANKVLEESEFFYPAYVYRQEAHYHLYQAQQVVDDFYRAVELAPDQGKPYVTVIRMLMDFNMMDDCKNFIEMGNNNGVHDAEFYWVWADCCRRLEECEKAITNYYKALRLDESLYDAWIDLGETYEALGRIDEAIDAMEKGVNKCKKHDYVHNALMNLYLKRFEKSRDREDFNQGVMHADAQLKIVENAYFYRERAYLYIEDMQFEPALKDIKKSYELAPEDLYAVSSMGFIHKLMGDYEKAIYYYEEAEKYAETPEQKFSFYRWWGPIYERAGKFKEALSCYEKCIKINRESAEVYEEIANIYMRMNEYEKAAKYYEKTMRIDANYKKDILIKVAGAYHYAGNALKVRKSLKQLELEYSHVPEVLCKIGEFYLEEKNDLKKAYQYYLDACGHDLEEPYVKITEIYHKMGKSEDAKKMCHLAEKKIAEIYGSMEDFFRKKGNQKFIYYHISMMYYYSEELEKAIYYCNEMKKRPMCYFCPYGFCYEEAFIDAVILALEGHNEESLAICKKILKQDRNLGEVHHFIKRLEESNKHDNRN